MAKAGTAASNGGTTRDRLIEATAGHLARLGPRGVELRSVCIELGISPSLVNYHFDSVGELLWLAAVHGYAAHVEGQRKAVASAPSGSVALERWLRGTLDWKKDASGIAAVIDYPMLAFAADEPIDIEDLSKQISDLSRTNVASLASAVFAAMTGKPVRMLSSQRVALLIKTNKEFAFWVSTCGFGGQGAATWIAGRRPYSPLWKMFGFSPDRQIKTTIGELVRRVGGSPSDDLLTFEGDEGDEG
jgi:AcrR family transcriptional regulator